MVRTLPTVLLAASGTAIASSLAERQAGGDDTPCEDVHVFLWRGNNEPYPGRQGSLVEAICSGLPSCDYEDVQFYNPLESVYCEAVEEGAANGIAQVTAYNKRCPDSKLVVSGYSQGAHALGDVLGGGGGTFFQDCVQKNNEGLDASTAPGNKIVAGLIFGDVRHTGGQSYNYLSGAGDNGLFPRPGNQLAALNTYAGVLRAYCDETDPICAGGNVVANHLNYFELYSESAGEWVQEMVAKAGGDSSSSTASSTASSSSTTTSSTTSASSASSTDSSITSSAESTESSASSSEADASASQISETASSASSDVTSATSSADSTSTRSTSSPSSDVDSATSQGSDPSATEEPGASESTSEPNGGKGLSFSGSLVALVCVGAIFSLA